MQIIKLKFRQTSEKGFLVTLNHQSLPVEIEGFLPRFPSALLSSFEQWQTAYRQLEELRLDPSRSAFRLTPKSVTVVSHSSYSQAVKTHLNQWLNNNHKDWQPIREGLISLAHQFPSRETEEIQLIIDAQNLKLCHLPWQEWDLLEQYYPHTEAAFCTAKGKQSCWPKISPHQAAPVPRILVVIGRSQGINTYADLANIRELAPDSEIVCLQQPSLKELCEALWDESGHHIFIFTGHSRSEKEGKIGWLEVNDQESLSIEAFRDALKTAINKGLQLAIFNSCDGLGLAYQLADLNLPHSIVMREPVPDEVAMEFLQYFFKEFTANKSLFASVQIAKKKLEPFREKYPGACWLPTLCLSAAVTPLTWKDLNHTENNRLVSAEKKLSLIQKIGLIILVSLLSFWLGLSFNSLYYRVAKSYPNWHYSTLKSIKDYPRGTWQYSGSTTWAPIREIVDQHIKQQHPDFNLVYTPHPTLPPGSGTGIKMLLDGEIAFAQSSRPLNNDEYQLANQRGIKIQQIPIAIDSIAVVVNQKLNINNITLKQLEAIYSGKIRNWNQLGGETLEIIPYLRPVQSGTTEFFQENILGKQNLTEKVNIIDEPDLALHLLSQENNRGGIYLSSTAELINQCRLKPLSISRQGGENFILPYKPQKIDPKKCNNQLNIEALKKGDYPLTRRLFLIKENNVQIDGKVGDTYQKFLGTDEAQKLIKKAGFIPVPIF
ncbi:substrate-binding domain-containing protein [Gloeothece verrucosa]|uniref:ABC-type phosphate transport system periplasmic component-like protein n=1 Tax=Gloeothece verrucosa (strain PCC 7822) TaxID=497965 RepID=E0U934_GLOV7|nr:substrate-binding domain-containing protein [Gloeothece verrucosa]ADN16173.1 ABC-type phosphate transport system periplasmic component-like protein [Gloeothece verrucosa PCC 7822]